MSVNGGEPIAPDSATALRSAPNEHTSTIEHPSASDAWPLDAEGPESACSSPGTRRPGNAAAVLSASEAGTPLASL
jgi:hypothetical protein